MREVIRLTCMTIMMTMVVVVVVESDLNVVFSLSGFKVTDHKEKLLLLLEYFGFFLLFSLLG